MKSAARKNRCSLTPIASPNRDNCTPKRAQYEMLHHVMAMSVGQLHHLTNRLGKSQGTHTYVNMYLQSSVPSTDRQTETAYLHTGTAPHWLAGVT